MSSNPRKFSEKIAIHQRKLMEEQNAFKQIMNEVQVVKTNPTLADEQAHRSQAQGGGLGPPAWPTFRGGSLPNVYQFAQQGQQQPDLQSYIDAGYSVPQASSSYVGSVGYVSPHGHGPMHARGRSPGAVSHYHPYPHPRGFSSHSPTRSPIHNSTEHQLANPSLYGVGSMYSGYLLPPAESNWRRASSDPCVHASVMHPNVPGNAGGPINGSPTHTPPTRSPPGVCMSPESLHNGNQIRPNSPGSHIPNINIYPIEQQHGSHVAISTNAGSLSELASGNFQTPLSQPVDQDAQGHLSYQQILSLNMDPSSGVARTLQQSFPPLQFPLAYQQTQTQNPQPLQQQQQQQTYDSKSSNPGSPSAAGDSPVLSPQQPCSPNSTAAYYQLQAQLQNFGINAMGGETGTMANMRQQYSTTSVYSTEPNMTTMSSYLPQYSSAVYQSTQSTPPSYAETTQQHNQYAKHQQVSPQSSQIPNIVLTNFDDNTRSPYDPSNELNMADCEALKMGLDLSDLSDLQLDASQDLRIDAATEDALRMDRA